MDHFKKFGPDDIMFTLNKDSDTGTEEGTEEAVNLVRPKVSFRALDEVDGTNFCVGVSQYDPSIMDLILEFGTFQECDEFLEKDVGYCCEENFARGSPTWIEGFFDRWFSRDSLPFPPLPEQVCLPDLPGALGGGLCNTYWSGNAQTVTQEDCDYLRASYGFPRAMTQEQLDGFYPLADIKFYFLSKGKNLWLADKDPEDFCPYDVTPHLSGVSSSSSSSSESFSCEDFPLATAACPDVAGLNWCSYLAETYENGCPKTITCGVLSNGVCSEWDGSLPAVPSSSSSFSCASLPIIMPVCEPFPGVPLSDNCMYISSYYDNGCPYVYSCGVLVNGECVAWVPGSSSVSSVVTSSTSSVPGGGSVPSGGSVDGSVGVALDGFVCARRRPVSIMSGLELPELGTIVPTYLQLNTPYWCTPAQPGEMMNETIYDSSYPVKQTMVSVMNGISWVRADYGVVGRFKKVRVGPPPCYGVPGGAAAAGGARNGKKGFPLPNTDCDGAYYLGATVQYSVDGQTWFFVGQTTSAPFLNSGKTLVGTELVGDDEVKEARYIRIFGGSSLFLAVSELHAVRLDELSSPVFSGELFCATLSDFDSNEFEVVSGPYPNSWSCDEVCGVYSSSSSSS